MEALLISLSLVAEVRHLLTQYIIRRKKTVFIKAVSVSCLPKATCLTCGSFIIPGFTQQIDQIHGDSENANRCVSDFDTDLKAK